jgi:ribosomal protein L30E
MNLEKNDIISKVITLELPRRNKIVFSSFDTLDEKILNEPLVSLIESLKNIIPESILEPTITTPGSHKKYSTNIELCCNHINYVMRITTKSDILPRIIENTYKSLGNCCYLEINGRIYKNGLFKDILSLEYMPFSFRQPDDSIREFIIQWLQRNFINVDLLVLIGGECTLFGKILSGYSKDILFLTDFQSIVDDVYQNYKSPMVYLINYETWKKELQDFHRSENMFICGCKHRQHKYYDSKKEPKKIASIINTGIQGMGHNLATEVCKINANKLYIISCNPESWKKDWIILNQYYSIENAIEIRTNYSVWIYVLVKM